MTVPAQIAGYKIRKSFQLHMATSQRGIAKDQRRCHCSLSAACIHDHPHMNYAISKVSGSSKSGALRRKVADFSQPGMLNCLKLNVDNSIPYTLLEDGPSHTNSNVTHSLTHSLNRLPFLYTFFEAHFTTTFLLFRLLDRSNRLVSRFAPTTSLSPVCGVWG